MTAVGLVVLGAGVILIWAGWTGENPLTLIREAVGA